ncbi:hypothetical protein ACTXT7_013733 [Hymenolepis weldensis]
MLNDYENQGIGTTKNIPSTMPPRPTINSTDILQKMKSVKNFHRGINLGTKKHMFTPSSASRPIVRYPHLTELNQQSRFITEEEAQNRNRWYRVNLSGPLKNFPSNLCHMTHITTLVIKNNNLERLPPELGNLKNLVNLDASYNRLRYLPETIGNLTDLKAIILNDNYLNDLPIEIGCCFNIRYMMKFYGVIHLPNLSVGKRFPKLDRSGQFEKVDSVFTPIFMALLIRWNFFSAYVTLSCHD